MHDERKTFAALLDHSPQYLCDIFELKNQGTVFAFILKEKPEYYITVAKELGAPSLALVNANFGFDRPAGSNNYLELIDLGKHFASAFGVANQLRW